MWGTKAPNRRGFACAEVERKTGLTFFPKLAGKDSLKRTFDASAWDWSKSQRKRVVNDEIRPLPKDIPLVKVPDSDFTDDIREEYFAGRAMPVGSRKAAPVCDKWPDTGWWLSTNSNKRHNRKCENYRKTRGYPCRKDEGVPCKKCGG